MAKIDAILKKAVEIKASDIHIATGNPPMYRQYGKLKKFKSAELASEASKALIYEILTPEQHDCFIKDYELDFCYEIEGVARFRGNVLNQRTGIDASFRVMPSHVPSLDDLGHHPVVKQTLENHQGLILVAGEARQGKSTTVAAMVDHINENQAHHILTVEDPIEFVHPIKKGVVIQREIGKDTLSYANALKGALREDPDVVLVGEMRDLEAVEASLREAETGHLTFSTLHTNSAAESISRIIDIFPAQYQSQVRIMLSMSLEAVITQSLLPRADGKGRVLALEILIPNPAIRNLIRENKIHQIYSSMQMGQEKFGMQTFNQSLASLYFKKAITLETAMNVSSKPEELTDIIQRREGLKVTSASFTPDQMRK